jgi:hypothetical protein
VNLFVVGYEQRVSAVVCHISGKLAVGPTAFEMAIPRYFCDLLPAVACIQTNNEMYQANHVEGRHIEPPLGFQISDVQYLCDDVSIYI